MKDRKTYIVEEYNRNIPLLFSENNQGVIHSKFDNGFNIKIADSLLFIGSNRSGELPFAFILPLKDVHDLLANIRIGDPVTWDLEQKILSINESCDIVYLEGKPYENKLDYIPGSQSLLVTHLETLLLALSGNGERTGLNIDINDFMEDYVTQEEKENSTYAPFYTLMDSLYSDDKQEIEAVLRYFLGRGKGGTPAGDDHIIGLMAIQTISKEWTPLFPEVLSELIQEDITTDVSLEYLKYALKDQYGSPVIGLMEALVGNDTEEVQMNINNLLAMGHSSGLDTTFGILLGLLSIRRKNNG